MVARLLELAEVPEPADAADALAVAICHIHTAQTLELQGAGDESWMAGMAAAALGFAAFWLRQGEAGAVVQVEFSNLGLAVALDAHHLSDGSGHFHSLRSKAPVEACRP